MWTDGMFKELQAHNLGSGPIYEKGHIKTV